MLIGLVAVSVGMFVTVGLVAASVVSRHEANKALRAVTWDDPGMAQVRQRELAAPATQRILLPALKRIADRLTSFAPTSIVERLDEELTYGGGSATWDGARILAVKAVLMVGLPAGGLFLAGLVGATGAQLLALTLIMGAVGYYLPEWILRSRSSKRQGAIQKALPDALDLLSITVEAGLSFDAAMDRVSREIRGPLGGELYRVVQEMRLGKSRSESLRDLGTRTNVEELKSFVLAMVQAEIFGISIANVLNVQAAEIRLKRRQRAEEQAMKLPVKIIFPLLFGIFPSLFIVLLGPAVLQVYDNLINR